jgi:hypothetical protein
MGCQSHDLSYNPDESIKNNVRSIFGVDFPEWQDWNSSESGVASVEPGSVLLVCVQDTTGFPKLLKVNSGESSTLTYDIPVNNLGLYLERPDGTVVKYRGATTRSASPTPRRLLTLPGSLPSLSGPTDTYASTRSWAGFPKGTLWDMNPKPVTGASDYDEDFKDVMKAVIFTYFPNGRAYDNLPQIKESGYYNENSYPITTGLEPIVVSPIYRNDGTSKEVENCELYYYYFQKDLNPSPSDIKNLPLYRAIVLRDAIKGNDVLQKHQDYVLVYWDESGNPSWQFPVGYKIGFMLRSNVSSVKQGELWIDGRLNSEVNQWGHFKTSGLGETDPRGAWLTVNKHMLLCWESGTDRDYNDLIFEVSGGIEPFDIPPVWPDEFFMFCFEDQNLGDYDLNDVVIRGRRLSETKVEYALMACGAHDELYLRGISGKRLNGDTEVHAIFGKGPKVFINTVSHELDTPIVKDTVTVSKDFSFLTTQPWIYDKTRNTEVHIATAGQDPHAIMIPWDFEWPLERQCIKDAYSRFNSWGMGNVLDNDWYKK